MGAVYFYHLTRAPVEATLPMLLTRALGADWRVDVRGRSIGRMERLDEKLWVGAADAFLPHGLSGGKHDAMQPVLLTIEGQAAANDPACVMSIDGAAVAADDVNRLERVCILFDGTDPDAVQHARSQWKTLTDAGCSAQYWSEDSGRWEMKAER